MAARMGRDSIFYTFATGAIFPIGLLNAVVLTRYLSTSQYGRIGVLFFAAGMTTVVLNLLFLRGTERQVWGTSEEGVDVGIADLVSNHDRPRVLGTGLMMSVVTGSLMVAAVVPFAPTISRLLLGDAHLGAAVVWAAVSAALGSTWRLAVNIGRWERRRRGFGVVWMLRPALALAIAWPLVAAGYGVSGAMAATAIGTLLSMTVALVLWRHSYELALDGKNARSIGRSSANYAALVVGLYVLHNGDVFMLSRYAPSSQVGVFRLATNVTSAVSYAVSAFLMAWSPLEFTALFRAAYREHGQQRVRAEFTHYYLVIGVLMVLVLTVLATPIISVFAPSYHSAEGYVAITGAGYLAYGLLMTIARSSSFPRRYLVYGLAALCSAAGLIATSIFLAGPLGGYGVAIGDVVGALVGIAVIVLLTAIWGELPQLSLTRIVTLALVTGVCYALGSPVAALTGLAVVLKPVSIALFVVLIFVTGVIPASHREGLWHTARALARPGDRPGDVLARGTELPALDRQILQLLVRERQPVARVAAATGLPPDGVALRLIAALRHLAGVPERGAHDLDIAACLLAPGTVTERDMAVRALEHRGVDIADLHRIEVVFNAVRQTRPVPLTRGKSHQANGHGPGDPEHWTLDEQELRLLDKAIRQGRATAELARNLKLDEEEIHRCLVRSLRVIAGGASRTMRGPGDLLIGPFLFGGPHQPSTDQLWAAGIDPLELHQLELAISAVRQVPLGEWNRLRMRARQPAEATRP